MASFDYRLNPLYAIKECMSCGALYTANFCCSKGDLEDKILVPKPPQNCATCGDPVDGLNCRFCAFVRKCLNEGWYTIHDENKILNTSDDNTNILMEQMTSICDMVSQITQKKEEEKRIAEEQAAKDRYWKINIYYDDNEDYTIAIIPILSTKEPVDSLIIEDDHLDTIPATESDEVIKSSVENLVQILSESKGISDGGCDVPLCDNPTPLEAFKEHSETIIDSNNDFTSSDDDYPYGEDIDYVDASPRCEIGQLRGGGGVIPELPPPFPNPFIEETNTFDNSLTESETFRFNLEEISSGSTTTRSGYSLQDYEAFYLNEDHIEEKSSGSTTTHADFSLPKYDPFIFDLSINPFPPTDMSDFYHEKFTDELAHIISPPELECFYFKIEPDPGDLIDPGIREYVSSTTNVNLPFEDAQSPLLAFVVWTFLAFLTYPVTPPYLLSCGNEDTIFNPGIHIYHSFMPGISHRSGTFMKFNVYPNHLNESPMEILSPTCFPMDK
ncbi:hypothetical protein Tco_1342924 [Tanacetum coccineum]